MCAHVSRNGNEHRKKIGMERKGMERECGKPKVMDGLEEKGEVRGGDG